MSLSTTIKRLNNKRLAFCLALYSLCLAACQDSQELTQLEKVQQQGYITVYTRMAPTTMYVGDNDFTGFEYDLVKQFADYLGVRIEISANNNIEFMLEELKQGRADFIAAGLTITDSRRKHLRFSPVYQEISSKLIYKQGEKRPRDFDQVEQGLVVLAGSSHLELLKQAKKDYPDLEWKTDHKKSTADLFEQIIEGTIQYTIVDSNDLDLARQTSPNLAIAFSIGEPQQLAWAFSRSGDDSLYAKAIEFFSLIRANGTLDYLTERYYGHLNQFDYVGTREFLRAINGRLPHLIPYFIEAAGEDMDWRFLAAMGYQESHWKADAKSPTGVRGIMMLTQDTAKEMNVDNRLDPKQSILGGARYFRKIQRKIPSRIKNPDRKWFALASYNVGFGHLEDARRLTEGAQENPDKWQQVKQFLPLLRQKKWYSKTRYGYARGNEPVQYVSNIRQYYAVLIEVFNQDGTRKIPLPEEIATPDSD